MVFERVGVEQLTLYLETEDFFFGTSMVYEGADSAPHNGYSTTAEYREH